MKMKVIQMQVVQVPAGPNWGDHIQMFALCDDGTIWVRYEMAHYSNMPNPGEWMQITTPKTEGDPHE
jgi:Cys-tRNA synthase (O-phospho-L-seryl-tRNA:Cys-tRNA synthase)